VRLLVRRRFLVPTLRGWIVLCASGLIATILVVRYLYWFLAPNAPFEGGALVVEGWGDDRMMAQAIAEYDRHHYDSLYVTGGPIPPGTVFSDYKSMANLSAAVIDRLSQGRVPVQPVPAPEVRKDRTFTSALETKKWMLAHGGVALKVTVLSSGPHSRRTWLLYRRAFGNTARIGIIAMSPDDYESSSWWKSSEGFRSVIGEAIAYGYARLFFWKFAD